MRRLEVAAVAVVVAIVVGLPVAVFAYNGALRDHNGGITLHANQGTWSPDRVVVQQGDTVRLRLTSDDVIHGFALAEYDIRVDEVYPGQFVTVEFVADEAGEFPFACTIYCDARHTEMRGVLVVEPAD